MSDPVPTDDELRHIHPGLRPLAVRLDSLNFDPANARLHDAVNLTAIVNSLQAFGQDQPLVVQEQGRIIRKGNGRATAAKSLGWKYMAAIIVSEDNVQAVARAIADNRTAELGKWDAPVLKKLMDELGKGGVASTVVGFTAADVAAMIAAPPVEERPALADGLKERPPALTPEALADTMVRVGEYRFILERDVYLRWQESIRQDVGFTEADVLAEIRRRLGFDNQPHRLASPE